MPPLPPPANPTIDAIYQWHESRQSSGGRGHIIITRAEAKALGLKRYFTGKPCKHGHVTERFTISKSCVECYNMCQAKRRSLPENKEKVRAASRKSYLANREKVLEKGRIRNATGYNKEYYYKNTDKFIECVKAWIKSNPERRKVYRNNRRCSVGSASKQDIDKIRDAQLQKCAICKTCLKKHGEHIDHIMPLAMGGTGYPANLQLLCPTCNRRKGAKDPIAYMQELGMLL